MRALWLVPLLVLGGCAALIPDPPPLPPTKPCPALVQYTLLEQQVLADEFPKDGPETQTQIEDYLKVRQACK